MAWNGKKKCYECDRCGKFIGYFTTQTLCKECNKWLKEYMSRYAEKTVGCTDKIKETHVNSGNWDLCKVLDNTLTKEVYTKVDMVAMLEELKKEIEELWDNRYDVWLDNQYYIGKSDTLEEVDEVIQQKINELKTECEDNNVQTM